MHSKIIKSIDRTRTNKYWAIIQSHTVSAGPLLAIIISNNIENTYLFTAIKQTETNKNWGREKEQNNEEEKNRNKQRKTMEETLTDWSSIKKS